MNYLKISLEPNYYVSAIWLIVLALTSLVGKESLFVADPEIYGPLGNNLQLVGAYLALMEILVWVYCFVKRNFSSVAFLGVFFLLIPSSLQMYADINDLPIDSDLGSLFWYTGLSHIAFGILFLRKRHY